jgi:hypothetical protein
MKYIRILLVIFLGAPTLSFAQQGPDLSYLTAAIGSVGEIVTKLIPLVIAIGLLVFIWSVIKFIANSHDAEARSAGLRQMGWGIVGLFLIVSVWGIVSLLANIVGITPVTALVLPTVPQ